MRFRPKVGVVLRSPRRPAARPEAGPSQWGRWVVSGRSLIAARLSASRTLVTRLSPFVKDSPSIPANVLD